MTTADALSHDGSVMALALLSLLLAYAIARPLLGVVVHLVRARRADRRYRPGLPLAAGPAIVRGTVAPDDDGAVVVEVDLRLQSKHPRSGNAQTWEEFSRHGSARPFRLRLDSGASLTVDPGDRWTLIDELEPQWLPLAWVGRTRVARLSAGETVVAVGQLVAAGEPTAAAAAGYREPPERALVLQPAKDAPLLLASGSLGRRYRLRARTWVPWLVAAVALTVFQLHVVLGRYRDLAAHGQPVMARITALYDDPPDSTHRKERCSVTAATPSGEQLEDTLDCPTSPALHVGAQVPFVRVPGRPASAQLGSAAQLSVDRFVLALFLVLVGLVVMEYQQRRSLRWYHPHPLTERE